mgnify:CR=1 FL=1
MLFRSIVLPLPVGQSSECEILDFESVEDSTGAGVAEALNTGMPAGLRVLDCYAAVRPVREMVNLRARLRGNLYGKQQQAHARGCGTVVFRCG